MEFVGLEGNAAPPPRVPTGIAELDRVLGGGIVPASAVLVGGAAGLANEEGAIPGHRRLDLVEQRVNWLGYRLASFLCRCRRATALGLNLTRAR